MYTIIHKFRKTVTVLCSICRTYLQQLRR